MCHRDIEPQTVMDILETIDNQLSALEEPEHSDIKSEVEHEDFSIT
jgi:uncharacterized protein HemX